VFDYNPNELVPSHLPDELDKGMFPITESQYDILTRARWFAKQIRLTSIPSTLLRITQMQEQLKYLQLKRGQAPISWSTVMKKLDVQNYGEVPGLTEREKYFNEEIEMQKMQIIAQVQAQQFLKQLGIDPAQLQGGQGQGGSSGSGGSGGSGGASGAPASPAPLPAEGHKPHPGGRPPSGEKPPQIKQKGGAGGDPRTTITES